MTLLTTIALAIVGLFVLLQLFILWQTKRQVGQPVPLSEVSDKIDSSRTALLYFHSPQCGACRAMTPMIAELGCLDGNVVSIDVSRHMEVARAYAVRATPTLVVLKNDTIQKVLVGAQSRRTVEALLV